MRSLLLLLAAGLPLSALSTASAQDQPAQEEAASETPASETPGAQTEQQPAPEKKKEPIVDDAIETATHEELPPLGVPFEKLSTLCLHVNGNLLAADEKAQQIKVINPEGQQIAVIALDFPPEAIEVAADGVIYCGGQGKIAMLDPAGQILKVVELPQIEKTPPPQPPAVQSVEQAPAEQQPTAESQPAATPEGENTQQPAQHARHRHPRRARGNRVSGIAATETEVFAAYGRSWSVRSKSQLFRFDRQLENRQQIAEDLKGCCQRCDLTTLNGVLYVAENAAYRVVLLDRDGNRLAKWGSKNRKDLAAFGSCCNPMNVCFDAEDVLYTSESGRGRVKRYTTDGQFLSLVGYIGVDRFNRASPQASSCSNMALAVTPDGSRVYIMDVKNNVIRVLQRKQ